MIQDKECNSVYFAEYLQIMFPKLYEDLQCILEKYGYKPKLITATDTSLVGKQLSIWVRDYMPIQRSISNHILFDYTPDYLINVQKYCNHIPDGLKAIKEHSVGINVRKFRSGNNECAKGLNIDGGNMLRCGDYIVMTDKVFDANPTWKQDELIDALTQMFNKKVIILPWDKREFCGHTDGIVRYIGNGQILLNTYGYPEIDGTDKWFMERFYNRLVPYFGTENIKILLWEARKKPSKYRWAYINWLQLENVLIIPKFEVPEDAEALAQIESFMPDYHGKIEQVTINQEYLENGKLKNLVELGGCLNCASWTIQE
ncbi:MAG: agmatine deiminase family protein [Bacteroidales bacterium]|nr:agmatine deiminase family protein [Candidatus Colimorpha pelethequi]